MHTLKLEVNESIYSQVLSFINQFQNSEISIVEDEVKNDFMVSSIDEVRRRVMSAESNGNYIDSHTFWSDVDKKIEAL